MKAFEAEVGFLLIELCLALPSDVARIISSAMGMYQGKEFMNYLFREHEQLGDLKSSDFYVPWFSEKITTRNSPYKREFERRQFGKKWAYKPKRDA